MPQIPGYQQQTSTPSGERRVSVGPTDQSGNMLTGLANAVSDAASVVGGTIQRKRDEQQAALDAYDRQQDALRRVEAKEWADNTATDVLLRKHERMAELKREIPADGDFFEEWRKEEARIDAEAKSAAPSGNPYFGSSLESQLGNQRKSFQLTALQFRETARAVKSEFDFEKKIDTNRKVLQKLPALDADAQAAEIVRGMESDAGLALLQPNQAEALAEKKRQDLAETVFEQHLQNPEDAQNLLNAIDGAGRTHFVRKAGTNRLAGKPLSGGKWDSKLRAAAEKYGLDPSVLIATMRQEIGGNEGAVSPKGAQGLLQLMPGTARDLGVDPTDPDQNIDGGARYLSQQIEKFGSVAKGLAAYNAGPGAVASAQRKADAAGKPDEWLSYLPAETRDYVPSIIKRSGIKDDGSDQYEAVQEPGIKIQALDYATPEQIAKYRSQAESYVAQAAQARQQLGREELAAKEAATKTAAATGAQIEDPITINDYLSRGYSPEAAVVKMALIKPYQDTAPFVRELANMPKAQRDAEVARRDPAGSAAAGYDFDAQSDAFKLAKAANENIDRQIAADPAGYAVRQNPSVRRAKETLDTVLQTPGVPAVNVRASIDAYVAEVTAFQKAQGIDTPSILPQAEADAIKSSWYGQADGPLRAAETMSQLATVYGQHYSGVLRQLAKDLPSEALWVGQLATDPATLGVRQQLATASATWAKVADIPKRQGIETAVDFAFSDYQGSLLATNPSGGSRTWEQLRDGAVKLAALKVAQSGTTPERAAKQAFDELVGAQSEIFESERMVAVSGENGATFYNKDKIRVPKMWRGKAPNQEPEDVVDGAKKWLREALPAMEFQADRSQAVYRADIKERGGWVTSPDDDGLVLMLGLAPVRTKDGKPVKISWSEAADLAEMPETDEKGLISRALGGLTNWFIAPPTPEGAEEIPRQRGPVARIPEGVDLRQPMRPLPGAPQDRQYRR